MYFAISGETLSFSFGVNVVRRFLVLLSGCSANFYVGIWDNPLSSFKLRNLTGKKIRKLWKRPHGSLTDFVLDWVIFFFFFLSIFKFKF